VSTPEQQPAVQEESLIGSTIDDRYRLLEVIGEGGIGRVYRAETIATGEPVAVKLLHSEFADVDQIVKRFEREAQVTIQLSHPNIVNVIEFGKWNERLFLAMELIAGKSLGEVIERDGGGKGRPLPVKRTLAIIRPVLDALDYAHTLGVVHRDMKPEKIMVIPGRGILARETVKLLDFGIAKRGQHSERASQKLTQHGLVLGTPGYMSPEQAIGQEADVRSDIYSCGVILYQMLTGRRPFEAETPLDVLRMHLNTPPWSLRAVAPDAWIPDAVENVVLRALAKRPPERFQTVRALREALEQAVMADYSGVSVDVSGPVLTAKRPRRRLSAGARFLCLALIAAGGATLVVKQVRKQRGAAAASVSAVAGAAEPAPPLEQAEPSEPEIAAEPSEQPRASTKHAKHGKHTHAASKRASHRRH
jgi:serine/threonine protein kinase